MRAIARELGVDPKTVRRTLRRPRRAPRPPRPSALDPYQPLVRELVLVRGLSAVRVLEELRAVGYRGGYTILKQLVRKLRPRPVEQPHLRFETAPGEQGQVDLSPYTVELGGVATDVVCFSLVLGWSRWNFMRFVLHADAHSVCHSHVLAFDEAGGVPQEILYDRMKQVVVDSRRDGVVFHRLFDAMARHYGFRAVALAPGYKEGKGKVENPFRYIEGNFLAGRRFHDLADLNAQAARWLRETAWVRVHRTTQEQPIARLAVERARLIPLPGRRFDAAVREERLIGDDFCVAWDTNRYSVPPRLAGRWSWARVLEGRLAIEVEGDVVAEHALRATRHQRYVLPEHEAEFRRLSTSRHVLAEQFARLGSAAEPFAEGLQKARGGAAGYHMSKILELVDRVGVVRVAEALRHAARYGAFDHRAVARIVAGKLPTTPPVDAPAPTTPPEHIVEYLRGAGAHQRDLDTYRRLADVPAAITTKTPEDDGERRDRSTAPEPAAPRAPPRRTEPR